MSKTYFTIAIDNPNTGQTSYTGIYTSKMDAFDHLQTVSSPYAGITQVGGSRALEMVTKMTKAS